MFFLPTQFERKRRTERKRQSPSVSSQAVAAAATEATATVDGMTLSSQNHDTTTTTAAPSVIYALGRTKKRFKLNDDIIQLHSDAMIINGPIEGTRPYGKGYGWVEMGADLQRSTRQACAHVDRLLRAITSNQVATPDGNENEKVVDAAPPASPQRESRDETETYYVTVAPSGEHDRMGDVNGGEEKNIVAMDHCI